MKLTSAILLYIKLWLICLQTVYSFKLVLMLAAYFSLICAVESRTLTFLVSPCLVWAVFCFDRAVFCSVLIVHSLVIAVFCSVLVVHSLVIAVFCPVWAVYFLLQAALSIAQVVFNLVSVVADLVWLSFSLHYLSFFGLPLLITHLISSIFSYLGCIMSSYGYIPYHQMFSKSSTICVMFSGSLFVFLFFLFRSFYCLFFFDLQLLIIPFGIFNPLVIRVLLGLYFVLFGLYIILRGLCLVLTELYLVTLWPRYWCRLPGRDL